MTYKLKTTGIAASCTMCIAVDPDTGTIKDFASALVTADIQVGANVTIATQPWDGNTRHYWLPGAGTADADFVKFGANKPRWEFNIAGQERTAVFIGEAAGSYVRLFGAASNNYLSSQDGGAGGSTLPYAAGCGWATPVKGGLTALTSGQKTIFGFSARNGSGSGFATAFAALHDAASMTVVTGLAAPTSTSTSANFDIAYLNRRTDSSAHQQDKTHAVLTFNTALTEAQWDSLRDDWFGTLLEVDAGGSPPAGTVTIGAITPTHDSASIPFTYDAADQTGFEYRIDGGSAQDAGTASPLDISGLAPETTYAVEIRPKNASGPGTWSTAANFTTAAPSDVTLPTLTGTITVTDLTTTGYTLTWPAGSDNVAVTGYEYSLNGGATWTDAGNVLTVGISGRTPSATDEVRVRAYDAADNRSTPALAISVTLDSAPATGTLDLSAPVFAFATNNGEPLASKNVTFWLHDATTGALLATIAGATDANSSAGQLVDEAIEAATLYRVDWQFEDGEYGVAFLTSEA